MGKAYSLKVEPMTEESFEPFGELIDPQERPADRRMILPLGFYAEGRTTLSSIWQPCEGLTFSEMERHFGVTQTFFQLSGAPTVVAAAVPTAPDPMAIPELDQIRAILNDPSKENLSLTYSDLATDQNPRRDDLGDRFGIVFELTL